MLGNLYFKDLMSVLLMLHKPSNSSQMLKMLHPFSISCRPLIYLYGRIQHLKDKIDFCKHCVDGVDRMSKDLPVDSKEDLGLKTVLVELKPVVEQMRAAHVCDQGYN